MKELEYPIDANFLMRKKRSLKRELLKQDQFVEKKIAILGGSTTSEVKEQLEVFLLSIKVKPVYYESGYNRYYEDALFGEELTAFSPEIVYIHTSYRNLSRIPNISDSTETVTDMLNSELHKMRSVWSTLLSKFNCVVIQNNYEYPPNRYLGNLDRTAHVGIINYIDKLNTRISDSSRNNNNLYINDINYLSAELGLVNWYDPSLWHNYKYAMSFAAISSISKNISVIISSLLGKSKKCLVLDLDNTLWGGIIGDDGIDNIVIGSETALGEAYLEFQKYVKTLQSRGVMLSIASKNEDKIAREGLQHNDMILTEDDFLCVKANWNPKYENILNIASEINIGLDSLVFIDDNPAEREIVDNSLKNVSVPNIGDNILDYINHIDKNGYFEVVNLSMEDQNRNQYYKENSERESEKGKFTSYDEYLNSLDMIADIGIAKTVYLDRIAQLTNKTNQFNLTTKRYSIAEIKRLSEDKNSYIISGRLKDKFGDNGLVSVIIARRTNNELHIDLWLMSCRVLKRDMEKAMFDVLVEKATDWGIEKIYGYYVRTKKNNLVVDHYSTLGFNCLDNQDDSSTWVIDVSSNIDLLNKSIKLKEY